MPDLVLSDKREITFDLSKLTIKEWRGFWDVNQANEEGDKTLAKVSGLKPEEVPNLQFQDYRKLVDCFRRKASEPLSDPNSVGASS